jgi:hypothetical protein
MSIDQWSTTAGNNGSGVTGINFAEGQAPSTLNDSCRELMAQVAAWLANPTLVSTLGAFTTGDVKLTIKTTADTGWVLMNDGTIGSAASGATTRANADTSSLYTLLWNNTANSECAVSSGRGANAAADFSANKTLALPKSLGRALAVYGSGSGLTARALALTAGAETHTLDTSEMPAHTHAPSGASDFVIANAPGGVLIQTAPGAQVSSVASSTSTASTGGGAAHTVMQPTVFLNVMIKL